MDYLLRTLDSLRSSVSSSMGEVKQRQPAVAVAATRSDESKPTTVATMATMAAMASNPFLPPRPWRATGMAPSLTVSLHSSLLPSDILASAERSAHTNAASSATRDQHDRDDRAPALKYSPCGAGATLSSSSHDSATDSLIAEIEAKRAEAAAEAEPLSEEEKERQREKQRRRNAIDNSHCQQLVGKLLRENLMIKFMVRAINNRGCNIDERFFQCRPCKQLKIGSFDIYSDDSVAVTICQNHMENESVVTKTIIHELIHAYDYCRGNVDFTNCLHHACTEVRAANLSGNCWFTQELMRGHVDVVNHHNECVRRRAVVSLDGNRYCKNQKKQAVDAVFEKCINDTEPFGGVP